MADKKIDLQEIGKRIKELRENKNITQSQLGEMLSNPITPTAISLYEKGEREPGLDVLEDIAEKLGISLDFLINGHTDKLGTPSIKVALRADKELWNKPKTQEQILDFIDFVKKKKSS